MNTGPQSLNGIINANMLCLRIQKNSKNSKNLINAYLDNIIKGQRGCSMLGESHYTYCNICNYVYGQCALSRPELR